MKNNVSEQNLKDLLETILDVEGEISLNDFIDRAIGVFALTYYDSKMSSTRPNEMIVEQRC